MERSIVAGRAVCSGCMKSQALEDCEASFLHADTCPAGGVESYQPWVALQYILDNARG
jgi:hypothetical protein